MRSARLTGMKAPPSVLRAAQGRPQFGEMLLGREKGARFMPGAIASAASIVN